MRLAKISFPTGRKLRQKATIYSALVVAALFGLFFEAYMHNFNLVYISMFFLFSLAFIAAPTGRRNLAGVEAACEGCGRLFAGREGVCRFRVRNTSSHKVWAIELHSGDSVETIASLEAGESVLLKLPLHPRRRGELQTQETTLQSLFPLSTVRMLRSVESECRAVVYPEPLGESLDTFLFKESSNFGEESDFAGVVGYSGRERLSHIHWPSVAKGEVAVKKFEYELHTHMPRFSMEECSGDTEARLSQLTLWVVECEERGLDFVLTTPRREFDSTRESIDEILEFLALY